MKMPENLLVFFIIFQIFALPVSQYIMSVVAAVGRQRKTTASLTAMKRKRNAFALTARIWPVFRSVNSLIKATKTADAIT